MLYLAFAFSGPFGEHPLNWSFRASFFSFLSFSFLFFSSTAIWGGNSMSVFSFFLQTRRRKRRFWWSGTRQPREEHFFSLLRESSRRPEIVLFKSRIVTDLNRKNNAIRVFVEILLQDASPRILPQASRSRDNSLPFPIVHLQQEENNLNELHDEILENPMKIPLNFIEIEKSKP